MEGGPRRRSSSRAALHADAARGMRPRQLAYRLRRVIPLRLLGAGTKARAPLAWRPLAAGLAIDRAPQSGPQAPPDRTGRFTFVGETRTFTDEQQFWHAGDRGLLFAFHVHGFAEFARYAAGPRTQRGDLFWSTVAGSWLTYAGEPTAPGWHPYPLSGRIMAWCAALSADGWPPYLKHRMLVNLVRQSQMLRRSVEHDIGGNHVLHNAIALVFAGVCLGDRALACRALALLQRQLKSQLVADGAHEERSTAYHRAVGAELDDVATLVARAQGSVPEWLEQARGRMRAWDRAMRGPDGMLPLLNDAWDGPSEPVARDRAPVTVLRPSGYVVLRHSGDQLTIDAGPVAPRHLPAHAHADVLSFVLWAGGQPLIIDPGSFAYTGSQRRAFRGTAAHNTVQVDGADQCELWGDFRAAFLPRIVRLDVDKRGDIVVVAARHDGYRRLDDAVEHERWFVWVPHDGLVVVDVLHAQRAHRTASRLHIAPGSSAAPDRIGPFTLQTIGPGAAPTVVSGAYAPYLGVRTAIEVIERISTIRPGVLFGWGLLRAGSQIALNGRVLTFTRGSGERMTIELGDASGNAGL